MRELCGCNNDKKKLLTESTTLEHCCSGAFDATVVQVHIYILVECYHRQRKGTGLETEANHVISRIALYMRAAQPLKNRCATLPLKRSSCKQEVDSLRRAVQVVYTISGLVCAI